MSFADSLKDLLPDWVNPFQGVHQDELVGDKAGKGAVDALKKHADSLTAFDAHLGTDAGKPLKDMVDDVAAKAEALKAHGTFDAQGAFKANSGVAAETYKEALTNFNKSKDDLTKGLKAAAEAKDAPDVVKNFVNNQKAASKMANDWFGQIKSKGIGGGIAATWTNGGALRKCVFVGGTLAGLGAVYDAFTRSQTGPAEDRKDRSMFVRVAEGTASIVTVIASLCMSKLARAT